GERRNAKGYRKDGEQSHPRRETATDPVGDTQEDEGGTGKAGADATDAHELATCRARGPFRGPQAKAGGGGRGAGREGAREETEGRRGAQPGGHCGRGSQMGERRGRS